MSRFSQRIGLEKPREAIQSNSIDSRLRNRLWTSIHEEFLVHTGEYDNSSVITYKFYYAVFDEFFGVSADVISSVNFENDKAIKKWAMEAPWNKFYDLLQFIADFGKSEGDDATAKMFRERAADFVENCNLVLEQEKSAYRFAGLELVPITSPEELSEVEAALAQGDKFSSSRQHLSAALTKYASRDLPDFRNSIKESISSIEAALNSLNGARSADMKTAITKLEEKRGKLHPAFRSALLNLYGWTSDESGIRHSLSAADANVGESEARFMLVACSALVNFLISLDIGKQA